MPGYSDWFFPPKMDRNHMLAPASHRRTLSNQTAANLAALGSSPRSLPLPLPFPRATPANNPPSNSTAASDTDPTTTIATASRTTAAHQLHLQPSASSLSTPTPLSAQTPAAAASPSHSSSATSTAAPSSNPYHSYSMPPPSYSHTSPPPSMLHHQPNHSSISGSGSQNHQNHRQTQPSSTAADRHTLPPLATHNERDQKTLPSLSSITSDMSYDHPPALPPPNWSHFHSSSSTAYRQPLPHPPDSPAGMDYEGSVVSAPSPERFYEGTPTPSSLTLDDPDVRLAAEALGDLRADFVSSPPDTSSFPPMSPPSSTYKTSRSRPTRPRSPRHEPLLSLLTTAHPFVASTISNANSVYGGAKNFSPRFKSGAEYVEGYLTPIANTVNSVGRATGVEGGVRWFLGNRRRQAAPTSDPDSAGSSSKRRKTRDDCKGSPEIGAFDDSVSIMSSRTPRRLSSASTIDTLPAYDDQRSPAYTEVAMTQKPQQNSANPAWQTRLIMSTSGLSVAMSAESLRSLKYCLRWLRWANSHMDQVILSLKNALEEYEKAEKSDMLAQEDQSKDDNMETEGSQQQREKTPQQSRTEIAARINSLKGDVLKTLQDVINNVSKYAGGALPNNAKILVRQHLTSLPQRFRVATMSDKQSGSGDKDSDSGMREGAQKVLVLAKEGLDMVTQVTGVLDGTIISAEQWCERMGKRRRDDTEEEEREAPSYSESNGDVKMVMS